MDGGHGKRRVVAAGALGVAILVGAGVALKDRVLEQWYIRGLDSEQLEERLEAARRLGGMRSYRSIPKLVKLLESTERHTEQAAELGDILVDLGAPATPALARALHESRDERQYWRRVALSALVRIGAHPRAFVPLVEDEYLCIRLVAIRAVGDAGPAGKEAIPALTRCLENKSHYARRAAELALRNIRGDGKKRSGSAP